MVLNSLADNDIAGLVNAKVPAISQTVKEIPHTYPTTFFVYMY